MPFKSPKQERWMFANKPKLASKFVADSPPGMPKVKGPTMPAAPKAPSLDDYLDKRKKFI